MSRYSSNSDDDSYRSKKARRKRHRSESYSSDDSYRKRRDDRRNRRSRSRSRDRGSRQSSKSSYKRDTTKVRSHRSRSPSFRSRRQRSYSRSRSKSRSSPSYSRSKYSKPKRRYKSKSRSRSYSRRRSRSDSRPRRRKRSRSRSTSTKKSVRRSSSSSDSGDKPAMKIVETKQTEEKPDDFNIKPISIPSDDPILKQQLLDDINDPSFAPKAFKSSRNDDSNFSNAITSNNPIKVENSMVSSENAVKPGNRKNETVFHDSIAFEDSEAKIQKFVKKLHSIRQRFLLEHPTTGDDSLNYF